MKRIATILVLLGVLAVQSGAQACLNDHDSDTLAHQAKQLPDVVRVITGRFEWNPPLYYQLRIDRESKQLQQDPTQIPLYDDVAVAYDRLHRDDDAILWIEKKRQQLEHLNAANADAHEQWYRYYANVGTFWAHRWLRSGADRKRIHEMEIARDFIAQALKLNPNAHFGRERYQLAAMQWIIELPYGNYGPGIPNSEFPISLGSFISESLRKMPLPRSKATSVEGLSGLIVLGDAWESVDIFDALQYELSGKVTLSYLARLRCEELLATGHQSFHPGIRAKDAAPPAPITVTAYGMWVQNLRAEQALYRSLRGEAAQWQRHRMDYMMVRLQQGRHPDTDPTFWNDYQETAPPSLDIAWFNQGWWDRPEYVVPLVLLGIPFSLFLLYKYLWWRLRRQRSQEQAKAEAAEASSRKTLVAGSDETSSTM